MRGSLPPLCRELPPYGCLAGTQERQTLLLPARRQRTLQLLQYQRLIRRASDDRLHDLGRQQRQPQDSADIALGDVLRVADLTDRGVDALIEHPLPSPRPCERLD